MVQYYPNNPKTIVESDSEPDHDEPDNDPGRDIVEKNRKDRLQRNADYTKEELDKVLKRVDNVSKTENFEIYFIYKYSLDFI